MEIEAEVQNLNFEQVTQVSFYFNKYRDVNNYLRIVNQCIDLIELRDT